MNKALAALQELQKWIQALNNFHCYLNQMQMVSNFFHFSLSDGGLLFPTFMTKIDIKSVIRDCLNF